ncbi:DUF3122 domain-containing protein [Tolypothrix sp. FACHB-123]|uniref:DUF3122 domain-containing protein n=1 Tax=Tolypothrix sp. FACHB-123 TaxID=2692868 RepID=UPI001688E3B9|nr:DUF3122 domain-containing protein [Tolypothrix sp. FACHB-123]MBD2359050.1 DUF3122 domain-containing protein [Tolypothrix sp. FACHB-123]
MLRRFLQILLRLLLLAIVTTFIFLGLDISVSKRAIAAITQLESVPGEIIYRSQLKLEDQSGHVWQVIFWKQVYPGHPSSINLRLVGFPGSAELIHPQPLRITKATGEVLIAPDVFLESAPVPTIGQYNFQDILPKLTVEPLLLGIPLPGEKFINISVPQSVVKEWQKVFME